MFQRASTAALVVVLICLAAGSGPAEAKSRYGRYGRTGEGRGFFFYLEAIGTNPRNTDAIVATTEQIQDYGGGVNVQTRIRPGWDDEIAGRIGIGYGWASGNRIYVSYWKFDSDTSTSGDGPQDGRTDFAIGPPIFTGGGYVGDSGSPGSWAIGSAITAQTADLAWGRTETLSDSFKLDWTVGLRYAKFEETMDGYYDEASSLDAGFGLDRFDAAKSNVGEMLGARIGVRGRYFFTPRFSIGASLAYSLLDGELTASSSLVPVGTNNSPTTPSSYAEVFDDGRSGSIVEMDVDLTWHVASDAFRVYLGWEQSSWNDIAADLVRNFPGTVAPLNDRDSIAFSGFKLGVYLRF